MTKPVTIPNTFATATAAIPLSNLDADFSTVATALNDANTYSNYAPDTGSANAYVVTLSGVSTTYSAGLRIQFKAGNANTTASTLNVNGGGAKNITYQDATAIASGTIAANSIVDVMYDGTQFLLMNDPAGATGGDVVGPSSATDNAIVRFDGTTGKLVQNSVVTIADSTGDISGVGQLNATTVDATNIEVTNIKAKDGTAAASIADSTGVISITSNPVLSGGTANGVLYLNGSKVATSGSALTFDGANFAASNQIIAGIGVATANVLARSNVSNGGSGFSQFLFGNANTDTRGFLSYSHASEAILFGTSSNEQMRLTSTGLGIGTSSPAYKLHVNKGTSGDLANFTDGVAQSLVLKTNATSFVLDESNGGNIVFAQSNVEKMRLDSSGNLGLGVTPSAWYSDYTALQIQNYGGSLWGRSGSADFGLTSNLYRNAAGSWITPNAGKGGMYIITGSDHLWYTTNTGTAGGAISLTQAMTLDASGRLLVGSTSAFGAVDAEISVKSASGGAGVAMWDSGVGAKYQLIAGATGANALALYDLSASAYRWLVDSSGNLLVGTTSGSDKLVVEQSAAASASLFVNSSGTATAQCVNAWHKNTTGDNVFLQFFTEASATSRGSITYNRGGGVVAYNTTSDYRLKNVLGSIADSGARIDSLEPIEFEWKSNGLRTRGFLAHRFQEVYPNSVTGNKDAVDDKGEPIYQAMQASTSEIMADLVAEIQSLRQRVALLEGN